MSIESPPNQRGSLKISGLACGDTIDMALKILSITNPAPPFAARLQNLAHSNAAIVTTHLSSHELSRGDFIPEEMRLAMVHKRCEEGWELKLRVKDGQPMP